MKKLILSICVALSCVSLSMAKESDWAISTANGNQLKVLLFDGKKGADFSDYSFVIKPAYGGALGDIRSLFWDTYKVGKIEPTTTWKLITPFISPIAERWTPAERDVLRVYNYIFNQEGKGIIPIQALLAAERAFTIKNKKAYAQKASSVIDNVRGYLQKGGKAAEVRLGVDKASEIKNYCDKLMLACDYLKKYISDKDTVAEFVKNMSEKSSYRKAFFTLNGRKLTLLDIINQLPEYAQLGRALQRLASGKNVAIVCKNDACMKNFEKLFKAWGFKQPSEFGDVEMEDIEF